MVAPVVAVLALLVAYPLGRGIYLSLTDANSDNVGRTIGVNKIPDSFEFVGLDHYTDILTGDGSGRFWDQFGWTLFWTVSCVALHFLIGLALALLLNRDLRARTLYRLMLVLPWAVPTFVTVFSWRLILADGGILNSFFGSLGLPEPAWLSEPGWQRTAAIMVNTWCGVPFMMVSLLGGLQSIPRELYEAAETDGASAWQRFRHVTLPGLRPVSSTVIMLGFIWTFNQFIIIFLLFGASAPEAQILVTFAYELGFGRMPRDYAGSAAYGVIILSMLVVIVSVYRSWLNRNEKAALS
ncbi:carbohydrate ABC transporter permease [Streptomyces smaragdinus]|nr:sugar ABC transporter permease [Streptomyces smaragdinus]